MAAILNEIRILECGAHNPLMGPIVTFVIGSKVNQDRKQEKGQPSCIFVKGLMLLTSIP